MASCSGSNSLRSLDGPSPVWDAQTPLGTCCADVFNGLDGVEQVMQQEMASIVSISSPEQQQQHWHQEPALAAVIKQEQCPQPWQQQQPPPVWQLEPVHAGKQEQSPQPWQEHHQQPPAWQLEPVHTSKQEQCPQPWQEHHQQQPHPWGLASPCSQPTSDNSAATPWPGNVTHDQAPSPEACWPAAGPMCNCCCCTGSCRTLPPPEQQAGQWQWQPWHQQQQGPPAANETRLQLRARLQQERQRLLAALAHTQRLQHALAHSSPEQAAALARSVLAGSA